MVLTSFPHCFRRRFHFCCYQNLDLLLPCQTRWLQKLIKTNLVLNHYSGPTMSVTVTWPSWFNRNWTHTRLMTRPWGRALKRPSLSSLFWTEDLILPALCSMSSLFRLAVSLFQVSHRNYSLNMFLINETRMTTFTKDQLKKIFCYFFPN